MNECAFPVVSTIEAKPCSVTPRKWCFDAAERSASTATVTLPSVPFLKPTGKDRPDASSRCTWDSVVRAPIAPKEIRSERYCGLMVSSISLAIGRPLPVISQKSFRETARPLLIWNDSSRSGSLIRPFHPTVVRGFSRYALMMTTRSLSSSSDSSFKRSAYSRAATGSCKLHGPQTTRSLSDAWLMTRVASRRPLFTA